MNMKNNVSMPFQMANFMDNTLTEDTTGRGEKAMGFDFPRVVVYFDIEFLFSHCHCLLRIKCQFLFWVFHITLKRKIQQKWRNSTVKSQ